VLEGLKFAAAAELVARFSSTIELLPDRHPCHLAFRFAGDPHRLLQLRSVVAVYLVDHFPIPRPLALLGHQHFQRLLQQIAVAIGLFPPRTFKSFRISAAGRQSPAFARIKKELAQALALPYDDAEADLFIRVRPAVYQSDAWEVLVRLSPRPLATRAWRTCNFHGALNATIAYAMVQLAQPAAGAAALNLMCGSGTILVEHLLSTTAKWAVGCDADRVVLDCARQNLAASGAGRRAALVQMDATRLALPQNCFDVIYADLPWGQRTGSHAANQALYPQLFIECARVAKRHASLILLTHEIRLMESTYPRFSEQWSLERTIKVFQGGLHPRLYTFRRLR
jgi:ubiquinone/menaquinone biosynthesis C-methylase UbiE